MKIVHLTSAHDRYDIRIFVKMCCSLAKHGWDVSLVVADGLGDEVKNGVKIYDVGKSHNRLLRIFSTSNRVVKKAAELKADIYHFHDSEILLWIMLLKKNVVKIVYDVHEDLPRQLLSKPYLNPIILKFLAFFIEIIENWIAKKCDIIVTVTPFIKSRFSAFHRNVNILANFPLMNEFKSERKSKEDYVCYVGSLTKTRGVYEMIELAKDIDIPLKLAGPIESEEIKDAITQTPNIEYLGILGREEVTNLIAKSRIGLCILHPIPNYVVAYPIKVFEYMSARTPVIASNFPLYIEIVEGNRCGLCVDPFDKSNLLKAIRKITNNKLLAEEMGVNGYNAANEQYNWTSEEQKLISLYSKIESYL